ncbi:MFS transporter [Georgenia thermotolerans]|uniref:MFS transporter n=1 Tax=Georgenia thermotolerans TaxID=527326 RepID=A0A7J5UN85_9MICO|nr:MFS transporter [Georgenia thermotolerans]KAE8763862.1 MFS transporter [Georgenia thermotolerans]
MTTAAAVPRTAQEFKGNDKLLTGIVLGVLTFWMFAGTVGTIARAMLADINGGQIDQVANPNVTLDQMNLAVSITALFSGLFIVFAGGLADRIGRVRVTQAGNVFAIVGSALVILARGGVALPLLLAGRAIQGLAAACIMPATMALVKAYWDGAGRQRAVSMWSIGSWGGAGVAALFGGFVASTFNWRVIFYASIVISVVAIALVWGTPESKAEGGTHQRFDVPGLIIFMIAVLALMILLIFGRQLGWTRPLTLGLAAVAVVGLVVFVLYERRQENPFIDFALFRNVTFTGATISNFVLNATIGMLIVSQQMLQIARPELFDPWKAGLLTLGYAVTIIAFIRVGERLLRAFGPRKPMVWGATIVAVSCALLTPTNILVGPYTVLAVIAYSLFGLGLAFYATPSTDAALSNLPEAQAGSGAGIYKMASSLGGAIGAALSLAIFTAFLGGGVTIVGELLHTQGLQANAAVRQAGLVAFMFNVILALIAIISVLATIPKGRKYHD